MNEKLNRKENPGMNLYVDTRDAMGSPVSFTHAVVKGLADGGGLFVPQEIPSLSLDQITKLADMPYRDRAAEIYRVFNIDLSDEQIDECMKRSYGSNFDTPEICPIKELPGGINMLELWHGPTSAFKDMALQCLPNFFSSSAEKLRDEGELDNEFFILVATSGDTGKAALEGFKGVDGTYVGVLYPDGGVSDIQRKQMVTTTGNNVCVWGVTGNFDDCQTTAKKVFSDADFERKLMDQHKIALSSANSINWGRLLPQIVYYISSYAEMVSRGTVKAGDLIDVCVPTGNFGNILAAWYAKQIGVPIGMLFCASNENRVLTDFIASGKYDISDREFMLTPSPSMDILVSSNLERQLFELSGRDGNAIKQWMTDLSTNKGFEVDGETLNKMQSTFKGFSTDSEECFQAIRSAYEDYGYLMDPHTAVAYNAARQLKGDRPVLVASTAHWAKFGANVYRALHSIAPGAPLPADIEKLTGCELNKLIADETGDHNIPAGLADLDSMPVRFSEVIGNTPADTEEALLEFLS